VVLVQSFNEALVQNENEKQSFLKNSDGLVWGLVAQCFDALRLEGYRFNPTLAAT